MDNSIIRRRIINQKQQAHKQASKYKKRHVYLYNRLKQEAQLEVRQAHKKYMEEVSLNNKDNWEGMVIHKLQRSRKDRSSTIKQ